MTRAPIVQEMTLANPERQMAQAPREKVMLGADDAPTAMADGSANELSIPVGQIKILTTGIGSTYGGFHL